MNLRKLAIAFGALAVVALAAAGYDALRAYGRPGLEIRLAGRGAVERAAPPALATGRPAFRSLSPLPAGQRRRVGTIAIVRRKAPRFEELAAPPTANDEAAMERAIEVLTERAKATGP